MSDQKVSKTLSFMTAGLGGCMGWALVHPFNTLAVRTNLARMQGHDVKMGQMIRRDGLMSLYNGLGAGLTRQVFYASSRFGLYEVMRDQMAKYRETDFLSRLIVGATSGGIAALISCPAEVSLVRMSNDITQAPELRRNYTSVMNAAVRIAREEGVAAFWRGAMPFFNRAMLVGATQVATYDQFRKLYHDHGVAEGLPVTFCASMTSGLLYSLITMPFETAKNRMAFQKRDESGKLPYKGTIQTISKIANNEGTLALWRGFLPYYGRCGGHTVAMFIFVEELRKLYFKFF